MINIGPLHFHLSESYNNDTWYAHVKHYVLPVDYFTTGVSLNIFGLHFDMLLWEHILAHATAVKMVYHLQTLEGMYSTHSDKSKTNFLFHSDYDEKS